MSHTRNSRSKTIAVSLVAAFVQLAALRAAVCACTAPASGPVTFISPANGSTEVSRFPVMTVAFSSAVPCDQTSLQNGVRLFDRVGTQVPLKVFCSPNDPLVVVASPASATNRLEPAAEYFLKVSLGTSDPTLYRRIHFTTGGTKSVFCVQKEVENWSNNLCSAAPPLGRSDFIGEPGGSWQTSCDENFYLREDTNPTCPNMDDHVIVAAMGVCSVGTVPPPPADPDSPCCCHYDPNLPPTINGYRVICTCDREEAFLAQTWATYAVIKQTTPSPGSNAAAGTAITVVLDRDIGSSHSSYRLVLKDITRGDLDPIAGTPIVPSYDPGTRTLTFASTQVLANRRYRASLRLDGIDVPSTRILSVQPHEFEWTFNTLTGPSGALTSFLPTPRTDGVPAYPTHLPDRPHLRLLYGGPLTCGLADNNQAPLVVRPHTTAMGPEVNGVASWIDQDMNRLHLMVFDQLTAGTRYDVFYSQAFKDAVCPTCDIATPVARFTVQVPTPAEGTTNVTSGTRPAQGTNGKIWLPVRPTVINQPYGLKERYAADQDGPHTFEAHEMFVPEAPTDVVATITVTPPTVPSNDCLFLPAPPEDSCPENFLSDPDLCAQCPPSYECKPCPGEGNPACPDGQSRCQHSDLLWSKALADFCGQVVTAAGAPTTHTACFLEDAYRCAAAGGGGCGPTDKTRMIVIDPAPCPATFQSLTIPWEPQQRTCVPSGKVAINLGPGEHAAAFSVTYRTAVDFAPDPDVEIAAKPIVIQPLALVANGGTGTADLLGTVPISASGGLPLTAETCKTQGFGTTPITPPCVQPPEPGANCFWPHSCIGDTCKAMFPTYMCPLSQGICDVASDQCVPIAQGREVENYEANCPSTPCLPDYVCNYGENPNGDMVTQCKKPCLSTWQCGAGYVCHEFMCSRPYPCGAPYPECAPGFTCAPDPSGMYGGINVCLADAASDAFDAGNPWTSHWVQVPVGDNIWRLWWPDHGRGSAGHQVDFAARIRPPGGTMVPLKLMSKIAFADCDQDIDPVQCSQDACDNWNGRTQREQETRMLERLATDDFPVPYGYWNHGYHLLFGGVDDPGVPCGSSYGDWSPASQVDVDGPAALYVKLPPGATPGGLPTQWQIEGTRQPFLTTLGDPSDLSFRGVRIAGSPNAMWIYDPDTLSFEGVQGLAPVDLSPEIALVSDAKGDLTALTFSNNYMHGAATIGGEVKTSNLAMNNNTLAEVWAKTFTLSYEGTSTAAPEVCMADSQDGPCNKPTCRTNADCRIPFWDGVSATLGTDPSMMATSPVCQAGPNGIGVCSHGTRNQTLFTDNVMLNSSGVHGRPYNKRMQRAHFENIVQQEAVDAEGSHGFWSFMDSVVFNPDPNVVALYIVGPPASSVAIDNNYWIKNSVPEIDLDGTKMWPGGGFGVPIIANVLGGTGLRITENTLLQSRGSREFGTVGALELRYWQQSLIANNTFIGDTTLSIFDDESPAAGQQSAGSIEDNLLLSLTRPDLRKNNCSFYRHSDVFKYPVAGIQEGANAWLYKEIGETPYPSGYRCLKLSDRRNLFREPLPLSPLIDFENLQRHIHMGVDAQLLTFRQWPVYDPALLDDALKVRPQRSPECSTFGAKAGDCTNPDPDGDLYEGTNDNCPGLANPDQANCDADSLGDACDPDDDDDGSLDIDDCDDCNAARSPGIVEGIGTATTCSDSIDNDCDGTVDLDPYVSAQSPGCAINPSSQPVANGGGTSTLTPECPPLPAADCWQRLFAAPDGDLYETITENQSQANKMGMTKIWTFSNLPTGFKYQLRMEGYRVTSDTEPISFSYKIGGSCGGTGTYTAFSPALTVPNLPDNGNWLTGSLTTTVSTTPVCIKMSDASLEPTATTVELDRVFLFPAPPANMRINRVGTSSDPNNLVCKKTGSTRRGEATVTVVDSTTLAPISGAVVTGNWTGAAPQTGVTATTNASGDAVFTSNTAAPGSVFIFAVTNVTHAPDVYTPGANLETTDSTPTCN